MYIAVELQDAKSEGMILNKENLKNTKYLLDMVMPSIPLAFFETTL